MGAAARLPLGRRRPPVRPARARPVRGAQPRLGPLPLSLRDGHVGRRLARARRRRPDTAAGRAAAALRLGRAAARHRPEPGRRDDRPRRASPAGVRLGRPGGAARAPAAGDRGGAGRPAGADARRLRRVAARAARRPPRRRAARRLPDGVDDVCRAWRHGSCARRARGRPPGSSRSSTSAAATRPTTPGSRSTSSATPAAAGSGSVSSTSTASGSTGGSESIRRPAGFGDRPPRCPSSLRCRRTSSCGRGRPGRGTPASTSSS